MLLPNDFILAARYGNGVKTVSRFINKAVCLLYNAARAVLGRGE